MKAMAVFPSSKQVKVIDHPEPAISAPTEVKLRMIDVGVCGTDKEIVSFQYGTPPAGSEYLVIGHESLGEVIETGSGVKTLKKGDLVVTMVRRPCDHPDCVACRAGRQDFCYTGDFTERGIKGRHGFMTEFVVDDEKYMNLVPGNLRDIAVLVEPLTIAEKAVEQVWQVQSRLPWACPVQPGSAANYCHQALVLGAGPVGLLGAMTLALQGFKTWVYSRNPVPSLQADICKAMGATFLPAESVSVDDIGNAIGSIDLVYEAVGASSLAFDVMRKLGVNGVFIFTGVPGRKGPIEVDTDDLMRDFVLKNQVIYGTVNAGKQAFQDAIRDLAEFRKRWPNAVNRLITGRFKIEQAVDLLSGKAGGIKNVVSLR
ncbi:MAG TPA: glucose 1-dehydrogenase [Tepidisphaeraceae bacterium]|jgi:threonine dehydrogenase-like Zn-dependent dehydrogenase|nr:glucose 1-dehydrogenase [Tepidisphaeraceae bacterium]